MEGNALLPVTPLPHVVFLKVQQFVNVIIILGPCAGKTTTVARLRTFFENLGWKVRMCPSTVSGV